MADEIVLGVFYFSHVAELYAKDVRKRYPGREVIIRTQPKFEPHGLRDRHEVVLLGPKGGVEPPSDPRG